MLVVDAFSGDSIPTHLLTREAMRVCPANLANDSVITLHISSNHFDLVLVLAAFAEGIFRSVFSTSEEDSGWPHATPAPT